MSKATELPEISDLIVSYDPVTLARNPVRKDDVIAELEAHRMRRAVAIVRTWPDDAGVLDARFVDGVLLRAHLEMQRLSEEFQQGARMSRLVRPVLASLREAGVPGPYRVVDVGCGLGYVTRLLASRIEELGPDVELIGCDYNAALVKEAARLARAEGLSCRFLVRNAFALEEPATIYTSTGVIHHFRGADLDAFFAGQAEAAPQAFVHCDIKPSKLAALGAWVFHEARMREPLAKVDGVISAVRAHSISTLAKAARRAWPEVSLSGFDAQPEDYPLLRVMQALVGVRPELQGALGEALGPLTGRVEALEC